MHTQGRCVGIIIGCTIGMAPLLWFDDPHKESDHESWPIQGKHIIGTGIVIILSLLIQTHKIMVLFPKFKV